MTVWERRWLLALAWSPLVLAAVVVLVGAATPGYRPRAETISALAAPGRRWAWPARVALVGYGAVVAVAARALGCRAPARPRALAAAVATFAVGTVVAGLSPKGVAGSAPTTAGHVHVVAALVGLAALVVAMWLVARGALPRAERAVAVGALVSVAVAGAWFRQTWGTEWYGVAERVALGVAACWLAAEAWWALSPLPPPPGGGR